MIIYFGDLITGEKYYEGEERPQIVDGALTGDARLVAPIRFALKVTKLQGALLISGTLETEAELRCCRCDAPFTRKIVEPAFDRAWQISEDGLQALGYLDDDISEPSHGESVVEGEVRRQPAPQNPAGVDLTDDIREAIILTFPAYPVCQPDCKGLCPTCGENRNKAACRCAPPQDNRWSALNDLSAR